MAGYGLTISVEGVLRLVLVVVVAVLAASLAGLVLAVAAASLSWVLLLCLPGVRAAWMDASTTEGVAAFGRGSTQTLVGSMGPAILIVGYPALVKSLASTEAFASAAGLLLAVLLKRAPFLVPLAVVQPAVVSRARWRPGLVPKFVAVVLAVGILGAAVAAAAGPALLGMLGEAYRVNGWLLALLGVDASLLAAMMLVAALRLAQGRRRCYVLGWGAADHRRRCVPAGPDGPRPAHRARPARGTADRLLGPPGSRGVEWLGPSSPSAARRVPAAPE